MLNTIRNVSKTFLWQRLQSIVSDAAQELYHPVPISQSRSQEADAAVEEMDKAREALSSVRHRSFFLRHRGVGRPGFFCVKWFVAGTRSLSFFRCWKEARKLTAQVRAKQRSSSHCRIQSCIHGSRLPYRVYVLARLLPGHAVGPKRRQYNIPQLSRPASAEWFAYLSQLGPAGGCSAQMVPGPIFFLRMSMKLFS